MGEQVAAGSLSTLFKSIEYQKTERRKPWGCSSVGRAPALQAGGQEFESLHLHWPGSRPPEGMTKGRPSGIRTLKTAYRTKQISRHPRPYGPAKAGVYGYKLEDLKEILHGSMKHMEVEEAKEAQRYAPQGQAEKSTGWMPWH